MPFDEKKADYVVRFIENLKLVDDFHGKPFRLIDWQKRIVRDVYGTMNERGLRQYRYVYVECAKKNAKSALTSGIGNLHLFSRSEPNGQIVICAGDREQAEETIYNPLVEMIEQDESLIKRVRITDSKKMIENTQTGTTLKVISAEAYTKHGWNISCCIFDELHVQPSRSLYDTMMKGAGLARRQPIWWFITTAGDDPDRLSIAWEVHEKATSIIQARALYDHEKDLPTWYPVIYSYPGEDIFNENNWIHANPSLGITLQIEDLRDLAREARLHQADERLFRWLNLNQWITTKLTGWLPLDLFDSTIGGWSRGDLLGLECYIGQDLSTTTDLSAIALVFPPQAGFDEWRVIWDCWIPEENMKARIREDHVPYDQWAAQGWVRPTDGNVIDYTVIEERIQEARKLYNVIELDGDRTFATMMWQRLEQDGLKCIAIPQEYASLTDPMNTVEVLLRNGKLTHENNPVARWCFGNTSIAKNGNAQIKYVKERKGRGKDRTKRIDLTVALVCAMARARFHGSTESVYKTRGLLTI
jgi:phage terminase large subunit-like protein